MSEIPQKKEVTYELVGVLYGGIPQIGIYRDQISGNTLTKDIRPDEKLPLTLRRLNWI